MDDKVYTINNKLITKVYYRRKFKARKRNTTEANQDKVPIFGQSEVDNNALKVDQGGNTSTRKRKPTPTAVTNFKRSKRQDGHNNDYKHSSSTSRSKGKDKKKTSGLGNSAGKLHTFFIPQVEFLDLAEIDRCVSTQLIHPHNPVHVLQKMAQEVCGIPPMEVSTEMLLEEHKPSSQEKSSTNPQIVPYGYF
jgi:hypothetical protein